MPEESLTYRQAGVDIDEAYRALRGVSAEIEATFDDNVVSGIGGFGGLYAARFSEMESPLLVSSIDGIGTKTKVAALAQSFEGLGRDIVNHCVNDVLCQGARPLFFMDYFGSSKLPARVFDEVLRGAARACKAVGMALIGGETAEMPGVYCEGEFEIVGCIVGVVDGPKRYPKPAVQPGDAVVGIASDGLHTNGFSLARRALFDKGGLSVRDPVPGLSTTIGEELLRPHRCYFGPLYPLLQGDFGIRGLAHITGGGLFDNLPRVLPPNMQAVIEKRSWTPLPIFELIREAGRVPDPEMYRVFNMGIGMALVVENASSRRVVEALQASGERAAVIGYIQSGTHDVQIV